MATIRHIVSITTEDLDGVDTHAITLKRDDDGPVDSAGIGMAVGMCVDHVCPRPLFVLAVAIRHIMEAGEPDLGVEHELLCGELHDITQKYIEAWERFDKKSDDAMQDKGDE